MLCLFSVIHSSVSQESVTVVTAENIHKYTIADLVLPLPGTNVIYPTHERMLHVILRICGSVV